MSYDDRLGDYNDVASRMREFFEKYPDGRLRPAAPWRVQTIGDKSFVVFEAAAYRAAEDPNPGIGTAWEPFPGRTPYTRDSELMNAETSAWGRAILAVGAADTKKGIASREEVRNRQAEREQWDNARPARPSREQVVEKALTAIRDASNLSALGVLEKRVGERLAEGAITEQDAQVLMAAIEAHAAEVTPVEPEAAEKPAESAQGELVSVEHKRGHRDPN